MKWSQPATARSPLRSSPCHIPCQTTVRVQNCSSTPSSPGEIIAPALIGGIAENHKSHANGIRAFKAAQHDLVRQSAHHDGRLVRGFYRNESSPERKD